MSDAQTARNIGIGVMSGLAGWFAGPVIARRLITKRPLLARNIVRGAIFGGFYSVPTPVLLLELTFILGWSASQRLLFIVSSLASSSKCSPRICCWSTLLDDESY